MTDNAAESAADSHAADRSADCRAADCRGADYPAVSRPMESTHLARSDASALADLQLHWGSGYEIGLDGDIWAATFRGTTDELRAHTCLELRVLIRADYAYRQQAGPARRRSGAADLTERGDDRQGQQTGSGGDPGVIRGERMSL
ncbi:MAG: hypothetical protein ACRDOK_12935 [Streptosporangiaceae bacterium]